MRKHSPYTFVEAWGRKLRNGSETPARQPLIPLTIIQLSSKARYHCAFHGSDMTALHPTRSGMQLNLAFSPCSGFVQEETLLTISALSLDMAKQKLHLAVDPYQHKICVKKLQIFQKARRAKKKRSKQQCDPQLSVGMADGICVIYLQLSKYLVKGTLTGFLQTPCQAQHILSWTGSLLEGHFHTLGAWVTSLYQMPKFQAATVT